MSFTTDPPPQWEKLGRILVPDPTSSWLCTHTGAAFALPRRDSSVVDVYVTGRDSDNRSLIGLVVLDLDRPGEAIDISPEPVLGCGSLGAFDENGVSYPCLVPNGDDLFLYYTGWMPTVLTPFQNHLGLARRNRQGTFDRVSRAPILPRTDADHLSIGSVCVLREEGEWQMWYTSFLGWGRTPEEPKHRYVIKHARSADGITWQREDRICIDSRSADEHSICRPAVWLHDGVYHMWFCSRGDHYRIGYAYSSDGVAWTRADEHVGIDRSTEGWDSIAQCYPCVFEHGGYLYMLYAGNDYGREGLGLARLPLIPTG